MKQNHCSFEERIVGASRSGEWSDELLSHLAGCRECEETALVASCLCESAATSHAGADLPDAALIWSKAQLAARREAIEKAMRPIVWARRFAFGAGAGVFLAFIIVAWSRISGFFGGFVESWQAKRVPSSVGHDSFLLLVTVALFLILVPLIFGLYAAWSED